MLKAKLGVERSPYVILGACNPQLTDQILEIEPSLGALLPCNVVLRESGPRSNTTIEIIDPVAALAIARSDRVAPIAAEAGERLRRVLHAVGAACRRRGRAVAAIDPQGQLIWLSPAAGRVAAMDRNPTLGALAATIMLLAACSSSTPAAPGATPAASTGAGSFASAGSTSQTSDGGQVTVVVDWPGPVGGAVFDVKLDTHSVDLDALDLSDAILRNDRGETLSAQPWAAAKGGHHREGMLTFDGDAGRFFTGARWVELVLSGVGDLAERTLRWEVEA